MNHTPTHPADLRMTTKAQQADFEAEIFAYTCKRFGLVNAISRFAMLGLTTEHVNALTDAWIAAQR